MTRSCIICIAALCATYCSSEVVDTSSTTQAGSNVQGTELQGTELQGTELQGMTMLGFQFDGATLHGTALAKLRIASGELIAEQNGATLHGADLVGAHLYAQVRDASVVPPATAVVEYQITGVEAEDPRYDPTRTGATYLYTLAQNVGNTGSWQPACKVDSDGRSAAIPLSAIWDEHGNRIESSSLFTFGCTTGVIAKCYRWGYRPWVTGYGDLVSLHWTCTRLARADYCGNGVSHTRDGTEINVWDILPPPGPIQAHGDTPPGMIFEAGWDTGGAVCLSHERWLLNGALIALGCPARLIPPGLGLVGATVCDSVAEALGYAGDAQMFDESNLNLNLDLL